MVRARRVVLLVADGLGVGELPDAHRYGDTGSNTLLNTARIASVQAPVLARLGLGRVQPGSGLESRECVGAFGRMAEASPAKDSMTGHWEIVCVVTDEPFRTYPKGFPHGVVAAFERSIGRPVLANVVSDGYEALARFGDEARRSGSPILYTSADSVFQLAAHVDTVAPELLYDWCAAARTLLGESVARVIARPFRGSRGSFARLDDARRDFPVPLPGRSLLHLLASYGVRTYAVGKVAHLFPGHRFDGTKPPGGDAETLRRTARLLGKVEGGLVLVNCGDLDSKYGHRNDAAGWASALRRLDEALAGVLGQIGDHDVLFVTGDHGNDPTTPSTDHSREYVPILGVSGAAWRSGGRAVPLGERDSFADLGATVAELLVGGTAGLSGSSFASSIP